MIKFFNKEKEPEDIKDVLKILKGLEEKIKILESELKTLKEKHKFSIQKIGIIRFNPFSGVGGDQSFSAALLDESNNGIVITSLFTQDGNRVYGKPIEKGSSSYLLSEEEKKAIEKAIKKI
ncbi:MAG: DUF4446 family protein [Patescibacteria group bacterium]